MITKDTWMKGLRGGLETTWQLGKIVFPITLIVTLLKHTPLLDFIVSLFSPVMGWFGLPGDAAIVFTLGSVLNLYAAIGAMLTMDLTVKQVFILSVMLSFSHNLIVETAIASKIGVKGWIMASTRLGLAFVSALIIEWVWNGGQNQAQYGMVVASQPPELHGWGDIFFYGVQASMWGILQIAVIIVPLMVVIQVLKDLHVLPYLTKLLTPFTQLIGVSEKTSMTLMAGTLFGFVSGAGVMIQATKDDNLSKKDIYLVCIFLVACHAIIEDTLLFVPLGIHVLPLLLIRLIVACLITGLTASLWRKPEKKISQYSA